MQIFSHSRIHELCRIAHMHVHFLGLKNQQKPEITLCDQITDLTI